MESSESLPLVVRSWLRKEAQELGQELVVAQIDVEPDCKVFYWASKAAAEGSQEARHLLAGNTPLILDQKGQLWMTGTAHSIDYYLADFRNARKIVRRLT